MRLKGKVALISGGARGMGAVEARLFAREGASVVIGDVLEDQGGKVEAEINETAPSSASGTRVGSGEALFVRLDVTSEDDWRRAIATTVGRFGKLDILVNNAAILQTATVLDTTEEQWERVMDVNVKGVFLGTKHAIPEMRKAGGGSIVNISSAAGLVGSGQSAAYGTSKGAVRIFTKSAAIQHAKDNIRVNSVHPGPIDTDMLAASFASNPERGRAHLASVPLGRAGKPE
ncbi:MAG: SDR family oxidoreductase, partial [Chloroflexi bacterium]|nr:SDR family oxidoreductase [Chloroflexota bacterium]